MIGFPEIASAITIPTFVILLVSLAYIFSTFSKKPFVDTLPTPPKHFLTRNVDLLLKGQVHNNLVEAGRKYGPLFALDLLTFKFVVPTGAAVMAKLLTAGVGKKDPRDYWFLEQNTVPSCANMLTSADDDPYYKPMRQAAAQALSMKNLKALYPQLSSCTQTLLDNLGKKTGTIDMCDAMLRVTMDVLGYFFVGKGFDGVKLEASEGTKVKQLVDAQAHFTYYLMANPWFQTYFFWIKEVRDCHRQIRRYDKFIKGVVDEAKAHTPPEYTLAAQFLKLKDPHTGGPICDLRMRAEFAAFMQAGFETTGNAVTLALFCIITHPEVESRVLAELESHGLLASPANPNPPTLQWEDLPKLKVLNAAILESQRLLPSIPTGSGRVTLQDVEVEGVRIPKGSHTWIQTIVIHRHPSNWKDPDVYDIDRWLKDEDAGKEGVNADAEDVLKKKAPRGFMPFSEGPRNCVGQALAKTELTAVVAMTLARYKVELAPEMGGPQGFLDSLQVQISLKSKNGLLCRLTPRASLAG